MKRICLFIILLILTIIPAIAIEDTDEVVLDIGTPQTAEDSISTATINETTNQEKTLREKLEDVYHLEVTDIEHPTYLLKDVLTKKFDENSFMKSIQVGCGYNAYGFMDFLPENSIRGGYDFNAISPFLEGKTKDDKYDFKVMLRFSPNSSMNWMQYLVSDAYVATNVIPHHRIQAGSFRPPVGVEGMSNTYVLDYIGRSQIARTFGTTRKFGARIKGDYSLVDYDIGGYSSDTFWQEFFPGGEFISWLNLKPLGKTDGKYGSLTIGGGIQTGHRSNNYTVTSAALSYKYKKFKFDFEWANADGYNGYQTDSTPNQAMGFYASVGYMLTPKLQMLFCYDQFDQNKNIPGMINREYTAGLNYFIKGQGLKLMLNYAFCQHQTEGNSHSILLGTQLLL